MYKDCEKCKYQLISISVLKCISPNAYEAPNDFTNVCFEKKRDLVSLLFIVRIKLGKEKVITENSSNPTVKYKIYLANPVLS